MRRFPAHYPKEFAVFKTLTSGRKVQDFLDTIPMNFEKKGDTCRSPLFALRHNEAHCMEGAKLAAAAFWFQGKRPLLLDLETTLDDESHVVALFRERGRWGAVSKTNHAVLRYRDPIYKSIRELAVSYFNEYFLEDGRKTLRSFSKPFNLLRFGERWLTSEENLWEIDKALEKSPHTALFPKSMAAHLRPVDPLELKATDHEEWKEKK